MIEESKLNKVNILLSQEKYLEAEKILKDLLSESPENVRYLALFSEVNLQLDNLQIALEIINNAIGLEPDYSFLFYIKSRILIELDEIEEAEICIREAIELDSEDADYYAVLANIKLNSNNFKEALEFANLALEIEPENILGLNTRTTALFKLNDSDGAFKTIEGALKEDPNNAYTHANYGWVLLENGNHQKALEHFKIALINDPNFEYAQTGMVEALKAQNFIYRIYLQYAFWMSNLMSQYQWGVIIGFSFLSRFLRGIAKQNTELQPFLYPIIVVLAIFTFSSWVIQPIGNIFLRFNKFGKYLLTEKEKLSSNFVGISFLIFAIGLVSFLTLTDEKFLSIALFGFVMMIPYSSMFAKSKNKFVLPIIAIIMTFIGVISIINTFLYGDLFNTFTITFFICFILVTWIINYYKK